MTGLSKSAIKESATNALLTTDYTHHEIHEGNHYYLNYSVADIGAATTPDDAVTLTFTTPNTTEWANMVVTFGAFGGALCRIREGGTGGESPTGAITCKNRNRNSANTSSLSDIDVPTAGQMSYDATLDTGGTLLFDEYIEGATTATQKAGSSAGPVRYEWILKQNTRYQISIVSTVNAAVKIELDWYEHTDLA